MTTLAIMATYEKKRLKCYGTVAAGEHVAVTVTDGAQWIGEGTALRLRVLFGPDTMGVFPFADGDAWTATGTQNADAYCELNLNTLQAEKYLKCGGTCLWILDDVENHTLYATGEFDVFPWPKRRGIDEPVDLDGYPLLLDEINGLEEAFEEYQRTVAQMLATKQDTIFDLATIRSGAAAGATAVQPSQIARFVDDAEYKAQYGEQNKPAILFKHGTNVIVALDATPFVKDGMVADAKIVGGNLVITFNTDSGKQPISIPLTDIFDPDNYYDKDAVNALLNAKQNALTFDNAPTTGSNNPVKSGGIWSMIWGALAALPTGFTSLYDWVVDQLGLKRDYMDMTCDKQGFPDEGSGFFIVTKPDGTKVQLNPFSRDGIKGWSSSGDYFVYPIVFLQGSGANINYRAAIDNTSGGFRDLNQNTPVNTIKYNDETWVFAAYNGEKDEIAVKSQTVPTTRTVNGKALSSDVTLTGADIAVSDTDATKINAALAGKASKSDATLTPIYGGNGEKYSAWTISPSTYDGKTIEIVYHADGFWVPRYTGSDTDQGQAIDDPTGDMTSLTWDGNPYGWVGVDDGGTTPLTATRVANPIIGYQLGSQTNKVLASEAEAEALRTGKANRAANPTAGNLAALDANGNPKDSAIPAANVATKGEIRYDRITITTGQLQDHAEQKVKLNAATTTLTLPALTDLTGKVSDFGIDMINGYAPEVGGTPTPTAASFSLDGTIGTDYNLIVPEGEDWSEMTALAAGEMAQFYFTLSAFAINDKPTWKVVKQTVELVPVPVAP